MGRRGRNRSRSWLLRLYKNKKFDHQLRSQKIFWVCMTLPAGGERTCQGAERASCRPVGKRAAGSPRQALAVRKLSVQESWVPDPVVEAVADVDVAAAAVRAVGTGAWADDTFRGAEERTAAEVGPCRDAAVGEDSRGRAFRAWEASVAASPREACTSASVAPCASASRAPPPASAAWPIASGTANILASSFALSRASGPSGSGAAVPPLPLHVAAAHGALPVASPALPAHLSPESTCPAVLRSKL